MYPDLAGMVEFLVSHIRQRLLVVPEPELQGRPQLHDDPLSVRLHRVTSELVLDVVQQVAHCNT